MAFNESFWVAVAAAAPVIALANQFILIEAMPVKLRFVRMLHDSKAPDKVRSTAKTGKRLANLTYYLSYINLVAQAAMLASALVSLGSRQDVISLLVPQVIEPAGLCLIATAVGPLSLLREVRERTDEGAGPSRGLAAPNSPDSET